MQNSYYIEQGEWLIPTLNSLDSSFYLIQEVNTLTLQRSEKLTVVFQDVATETDPTTDGVPTEVDIRDSLKKEIEEHITGVDGASRICNLPYSFRAEFTAFAGVGLDIFIAGIDGTASVNIAGGFEVGDDRTFQFYGEFNIEASLKWKIIFFANGNIDWSIFGIKRSYIFDDVDHCVEWLLNKIHRFFWSIAFSMGLAFTLKPPETPIILSVRRRVNKLIGYGAEYKNLGYACSFVENNDTQIQTKNGHVKLGQVSDLSYSFRLKLIAKQGSNHSGYLLVELYWNQTRGSYNSDNDGDYFGYKIMFEYAHNSSSSSKSTNFDTEMNKRLKTLNDNNFLQLLAKIILKLDKRSIKKSDKDSATILSDFMTSVKDLVNNNMQGLTVDNSIKYGDLKSINKSKLIGLGIHGQMTLEGNTYKTQYHRVIFKGHTSTTKQREFYLLKIWKAFIGFSFSFKIQGGLWEYYDPFFTLPADYTESYIKTIFNGVNLNIKSHLDFYGYQNRICWSIYNFIPFFEKNREGFNKVIPAYTSPAMMAIPSSYSNCVTYLASIRNTKYMDEQEIMRFNYLEYSRLEKEKAEDQTWYTNPFDTREIVVTLEELWNSVAKSWEVRTRSNLSANRQITELYLDELLALLTHDLSTTLTLHYIKDNVSSTFIDRAKSEINKDLTSAFRQAFYRIIEPKEIINDKEFIYGYHRELLNSKVVWYTDQDMLNYFDETIKRFKIVFNGDTNIINIRDNEEITEDQEYTKDDLIRIFITNYAQKLEKLISGLNETVLFVYKEKIQQKNLEMFPPIGSDVLNYRNTLPMSAPSDDPNNIVVSKEIIRGIALQMMLSEFMDIIINKAISNIKV